jgi:hypothetical protein
MKATSIIAFLLSCSSVGVSDAFTASTSGYIQLRKVRNTHQVANLRIPFLGKQPEAVALEDPPTTTAAPTSEKPVVENVPIQSTESTTSIVPAKELSETEKLLKQVKEAGLAGVISYALWELGFWAVSVPVVLFGYYEVTGHWPDLSDQSDIAKLSAEAFAFVNFARFAVPLRIGLALSTTPWIQSNVVDRFMKKDETEATEQWKD